MSAPKSRVGTLAYMAPEIIRSSGAYDGRAADVWSCGVMLYVLLYGQVRRVAPGSLPRCMLNAPLPQALSRN